VRLAMQDDAVPVRDDGAAIGPQVIKGQHDLPQRVLADRIVIEQQDLHCITLRLHDTRRSTKGAFPVQSTPAHRGRHRRRGPRCQRGTRASRQQCGPHTNIVAGVAADGIGVTGSHSAQTVRSTAQQRGIATTAVYASTVHNAAPHCNYSASGCEQRQRQRGAHRTRSCFVPNSNELRVHTGSTVFLMTSVLNSSEPHRSTAKGSDVLKQRQRLQAAGSRQ
jgi:hypothetical protein